MARIACLLILLSTVALVSDSRRLKWASGVQWRTELDPYHPVWRGDSLSRGGVLPSKEDGVLIERYLKELKLRSRCEN